MFVVLLPQRLASHHTEFILSLSLSHLDEVLLCYVHHSDSDEQLQQPTTPQTRLLT
jgi:hypothetical protein